ncbi:hypothetical protein RO3G_01918 [Rhizopus delemar RA 99-880]|uniref:dual-specificity kinase n=1 Tax=Rhizopus delemar (strain RA 99-880 / ATCC MYA-4621 / FGSC 9543 / NRRL 43880) TaxID=246409 RepID=I1BLY4_RHIO9|nr:hypothetical protein RO3G_01918 [Rhizopus delemar RA 99-880]|eukprot:EIE77214.1 hypothetical protein RO3G_01918 [Rhizopus delemar RA 99-880]
MSSFQLITEYEPNTTTSQEPWNKVNSTFTAERKQGVTNSGKSQEAKHKHLDDVTLEDLEDLIAASAKRLASYRLRNQTITKNEKIGRWKELLEEQEQNDFATAVPLSREKSTSSSSSSASQSSYRKSKYPVESSKKVIDPSSITTTRSALSKASPKIESPRISSSTTPRATTLTANLRKQTRASPQSLRMQKVQERTVDYKSIDDYLSKFKNNTSSNTSDIKPRKPKLSITNNASTKTSTITTATIKNAKSGTGTVPITKRRRGKTLPGSLAEPPAPVPLTLPPMKVEPLNIPSSIKASRTLAKTPTRIPLPGTSTTTKSSTTTTKELGRSLAAKGSKSKCIQRQPLQKPKSNHALTPKLQASKSNKSTDENLLRKNNNSNQFTPQPSGKTSLSTTTSSLRTAPTSASSKSTGMTSKKKMPTLQERLQGLVEESKLWTAQMEQEKIGGKTEIVLRGKGPSITSDDDHKKNSTHPKILMRVAMTPEAAQKLYQFNLTSYEKTEMLQYEHIYFVGHHANKRPASPSNSICNFGYDDDRGDYLIQLRDHLDYRYEVMEVMGKGSFGQVLKCFDHRSGQTVAVKIIRNKKRFHAQALTEIKILENLISWDPEDRHNNVRMLGHFTFRNHLCIVFECLSINLYEFIKSNGYRGFSMGLVKRFASQLLNSLVFLQKNKLIHCDLKPEVMYTYIQSRFYRSPEVIMGINYNMAIDMWSTGYSFGNPRIMPDSKGRKRKPGTKSLEHALNSSDEHFVDFVMKCLIWDPEKRMKPDEAFKHPWFPKPFSKKR